MFPKQTSGTNKGDEMILLGIGLVLLIVGIIWGKLDSFEGAGPMLMIIMGSIFTLIVAIGLIFNPIEANTKIAQFEAVRMSVEQARSDGTNIENTAMQLMIINSNEWLAGIQYENSIFFYDDFIPDEVDRLEPIR
jgi:hypothetical protein